MRQSRRSFIAGVLGTSVLGRAGGSAAPAQCKWFKGNLHMHTLRSDGEAFPDEAILLYKRLGYDFLALTDHHVVHEQEKWFDAARHRQFDASRLERFKERFPGFAPDERTNPGGGKSYRLRSFAELSSAHSEGGKFLLLSGAEHEDSLVDGKVLHCGFVNTKTPHAKKRVMSVESSVANLYDLYAHTSGIDSKTSMFVVNHPFWPYFDVSPKLLADVPQIRFFEIANAISPSTYAPPEGAYTADKLWDYANACRAFCGDPLLFGIAADDTHSYSRFYGELFEGKKNPMNKCHVRVRAEALSVEAVMGALHRGDFYASNGIEFERLEFDRASGTLSVRAKPVSGRTMRIRFIGTRKRFDHDLGAPIEVDLAALAKKEGRPLRPTLAPRRSIPTIPDSVGVTFKEVLGVEASYTLGPDDLYVRAKVYTENRPDYVERTPPWTYVAWTQPYRVNEGEARFG